MAVKNMRSEYAGVHESTYEAWHHYESSQATTKRQEGHIQNMMKFIEERGSPFSADCPTEVHNFGTKQVMTEEIRKGVLNASEEGKKKYQAFNSERIINKTGQPRDTIHRGNLKTVISIKDKPKETVKKVIRAMNMTEKSIEVARDRGLGTDVLLTYDVVPSPMLFGDDGLMTKPDKSQLIHELEETLKLDEYCYQHKATSAFLIDVMATICRVPLSGLTSFSDLLSKFAEMNDMYHHYGRCDCISDIYNENPSVKDTERLRRCSMTPVVLSSVELSTPFPKDMTSFWPSSQSKVQLEKLIYGYLHEKLSETHGEPTILSQLCMESNDWQCIKIHNRTEDNKQHLQSEVEEADLRVPLHMLDCL